MTPVRSSGSATVSRSPGAGGRMSWKSFAVTMLLFNLALVLVMRLVMTLELAVLR
jgi:hypothetical protein